MHEPRFYIFLIQDALSMFVMINYYFTYQSIEGGTILMANGDACDVTGMGEV